MLFPEGVVIDGASGDVSPSTHHYTKKLSELSGLFQDGEAFDQAVAAVVVAGCTLRSTSRPGR